MDGFSLKSSIMKGYTGLIRFEIHVVAWLLSYV